MKILTIMASPRRDGNSELLYREFIRGARESGAEVDEVILCDKKIGPCIECYGCEKDGRCVLKDDFDELYDKLETCDSLFIAMPIFFYAMPSHLKALIDRCQAFFVRKHFLRNPILPKDAPRKPVYLISVAGTKGEKIFEPTLAIFHYFFECLDMELTEKLFYKRIDKKGEVLEHPDKLQAAYAMGLQAGKDM
ncbi:MAG: flavodoxin family protein [Gammaproteobacteria bacterium]|nr:flavodoxin family protein [Gammaproteobacteria bacterium]